jgi:predicted GH43/DUF377 family glycosyl hydrolase
MITNIEESKMITLQIKRSEDYRTSYLNGKEEILSFKNPTELTNYFMREFAAWKPYNKLYWEIQSKEWFDRKINWCPNNDTNYKDKLFYFGGEFTIKLLPNKPKLPVDELEEVQKENELNYYGGRA